MMKSDISAILHIAWPAMWCTTHRQILLDRISALQGVELLTASESTLNIKCRRPLPEESLIALQDIFSYWQFDLQAHKQLEALKNN